MSISRTDVVTTSVPVVFFTDYVEDPTGNLTSQIQLPRPQSWEVGMERKISETESVSGFVETLFYYGRDVVSVNWRYLTEVQVALCRRLWLSTRDGTPFIFVRHSAMTDGWPNSSPNWRIHDNRWTVRWASSTRSMPFELTEGISGTYNMAWRLSEVL